MASSIIHIAVASEINKTLKRNKTKLYLGSIAPDISKLVGETKTKSHFLNKNSDSIPNIKNFLKKYKKNLNDDFVLGYYIHLYTDYLWFKYFLPEILNNNNITKLDGTIININDEEKMKYIYNDYSNINEELIRIYNLDMNLFYDKIPKLENIIKEIPMDKLNILIDKTLYIIENSKTKKSIIFDITNIEQFIKISIELILANINQILT